MADAAFEVISDIPLPTNSRVTAGESKYPYATLNVNQLFFIPNKTKNTMATSASTAGKRLGRKFSTRLIKMVRENNKWRKAQPGEEGVIGIGVWRVE